MASNDQFKKKQEMLENCLINTQIKSVDLNYNPKIFLNPVKNIDSLMENEKRIFKNIDNFIKFDESPNYDNDEEIEENIEESVQTEQNKNNIDKENKIEYVKINQSKDVEMKERNEKFPKFNVEIEETIHQEDESIPNKMDVDTRDQNNVQFKKRNKKANKC